VFIPVFTPATMPYGDWAEAFNAPLTLPPGMTIGQFEDHILLPENKLSETSSFGFKAATTLFSYDLSLSYYYGRDDLPLLSSVNLTPMDTLGTFAAAAVMIYPRMQVIGADMAGSIGDVGVWAEGALFIPKKQYSYVSFPHPQLGTVTQKEVALDDKPYSSMIKTLCSVCKRAILTRPKINRALSPEKIFPAADNKSRSFLIKVKLPSVKGVKSGMFARVLVPISNSNILTNCCWRN